MIDLAGLEQGLKEEGPDPVSTRDPRAEPDCSPTLGTRATFLQILWAYLSSIVDPNSSGS